MKLTQILLKRSEKKKKRKRFFFNFYISGGWGKEGIIFRMVSIFVPHFHLSFGSQSPSLSYGVPLSYFFSAWCSADVVIHRITFSHSQGELLWVSLVHHLYKHHRTHTSPRTKQNKKIFSISRERRRKGCRSIWDPPSAYCPLTITNELMLIRNKKKDWLLYKQSDGIADDGSHKHSPIISFCSKNSDDPTPPITFVALLTNCVDIFSIFGFVLRACESIAFKCRGEKEHRRA